MLIIVSGPQGCGKSVESPMMAHAFNCDFVVDAFFHKTHGNSKGTWVFERPLPDPKEIRNNILVLTHSDLTQQSLSMLPTTFGEIVPKFFNIASKEAKRLCLNANVGGHVLTDITDQDVRRDIALTRVCEEIGLSKQYVAETLEGMRHLQDAIHNFNIQQGWWDSDREDGTTYALIHSEISEAMEGNRKNRQDDHLPHLKNEPVELADALIRIFDMGGRKGFDLSNALIEKWAYNIIRADHKKENRAKENGKKY